MNKIILQNAKILYDYLNINTKVEKSDIIVGLGCMDIGIPKECVKLYQNGYGNLIVFSGNVGKGTEGVLKITEAERFLNIALLNNIPKDKILLEKEATNTYENYKFTKKLLDDNHISYNKIIIVQKPYVKRRCLAIAEIEFPNKEFYITSENLSFEEFIEQSQNNKTMSIDDIIQELVGEINIILEAPKFQIQSTQIVPNEILKSYYLLLDMGYTKHIITDKKIEKVLNRWKKLGL